jgi:hypothetical protein
VKGRAARVTEDKREFDIPEFCRSRTLLRRAAMMSRRKLHFVGNEEFARWLQMLATVAKIISLDSPRLCAKVSLVVGEPSSVSA